MGYSHYFRINKKLNTKTFQKFSEDVKKIVQYCENELGINIADGTGEKNSKAKIENDLIWLNGSECQEIGKWTTNEDITIPWPSSEASIIDEIETQFGNKTSGNWFAGTLVSQRVAPIDNLTGKGSGNYETLLIENEIGNNWCKTAYRPYDLCVTAILISFKHYFGNDVIVTSDGKEKDWLDGRILCNNILGYGLNFEIEEDYE